MNLRDAQQLSSLLAQPRSIVIIPHKNPDGDAIGSTLGLSHFLNGRGHNTTVIVPNEFPKFLKWVPGSAAVLNFERQNQQAIKAIAEASLIFTLDFNDFSRTGQMETILTETKADFVMIDHHQEPGNYAKITYSDVSMSSTCEMVYHLIQALDGHEEITKDIATCLYLGIMTDTGSFKYRSTTSTTHRVAADLIDKGAENMQIHQNVYDNSSPSRLRLLGVALNNLVILEEYCTAYMTMSQEELDQHNFQKGDTEGFVNYGLTLENINLAVIFIENKEEQIIKISFRSIGDFSVNKFARAHFNGGGHDNAAGGRSLTSLQATTEKFMTLLKDYKSQLCY
ncbi:Phosphoesterase RecJ domain protein [Croceitalea dokdonensis DOKDO 023]|uniref:Phosphoesterase RecJ domain protein n=1 Tax=Croceitalea dokdonensis DOKDO 023 TaxID=1300341 RepID=A0A0P7B160_9FLAO|nr:bifunctional oligoribonuclease/PAP phosphatase NrnA [Croceitalea dokdonensis]KPM31693.1 Phosphoesterase RecJ domain protein [Croceitalea dokdonensis DOKDO 023]